MRRNDGDLFDPDLEGDGSNVPGFTDGDVGTFDTQLQVNSNASEVNAKFVNDVQENIKRACEEGTGLPGPLQSDPTDNRFELAGAVNTAADVITRNASFVANGFTFGADPGSLIVTCDGGTIVQERRKFQATEARLALQVVQVGGLDAGTGAQFNLLASRDHYIYIGFRQELNRNDETNLQVRDVPLGDPPPVTPVLTFLIEIISTDATDVTGQVRFVRTPVANGAGQPDGDGLLGIGSALRSGLRGQCGSLASIGQGGVVGEGDANCPGVLGLGTQNDGIGVRGEGIGTGAGVSGVAIDGYGVIASSDTSAPIRSAFRMVPQDADPTTSGEGDLAIRDNDEFIVYLDGAWRVVQVATNGSIHGYGGQGSQSANGGAGVFFTAATVILTGFNSPRRTGVIIIRCGGTLGNNAGSLHAQVSMRVQDITAGLPVISRTLDLAASVAGVRNQEWSTIVNYILPAVGDREFRLEIAEFAGMGTGVQVDFPYLEIRGTFA